jgi:CRISPR-associated endonuclease/helicase Cas3
MYLAHRSEEAEQTLKEHLHNAANLARRAAEAFGAGDLAYTLGLAHDVGKYSTAFQKRIRGSNIKIDHSTAGGRLLAQTLPAALGRMGAYCVMGHHGGLPDGGSIADNQDAPTLCARLSEKRSIETFDAYKSEIEIDIPAPPKISIDSAFGLSFFTRLLYSTLVDADFIDTERFFAGEAQPRGAGEYESIPALYAKLEAYIAANLRPTGEVSSLYRLRGELLDSCLAKADSAPGLFTLTAPTGSGKTISSLAFALKHAAKHGKRRIIYVVPYNTIIEQNAQVFEKILGAGNVLQHHSGVTYDENAEELTPAEALEQRRKRLAAENWDYPVIVTSSVQFFQSLFAAKPSRCRKLHNIAQSVILFDEAQMLPLPYLLPCLHAIRELVAAYGCTAVLATATQSALDTHFSRMNMPMEEIVSDPEKLYTALRRVTLRRMENPLEDSELAQMLAQQHQALCIVNTRAHAQTLYALVKDAGASKEGVFHLSTTMFPAHRTRVLGEIRDRLDKKKRCVVISTSLVEAGVDLDFPAVYREEAGLDSIIQAAGRCNREGEIKNPADAVVYIFTTQAKPNRNIEQYASVFRVVANQFCDDDMGSPQAIRVYFQMLFYARGDALDAKRILPKLASKSLIFPFREVEKEFQLIENAGRTVYVLHEVPELEARLRGGERTRELFRALGHYAVSLYEQDCQKQRTLGLLTNLDSEVLLLAASGYSESLGVTLNPQGGQALMI